MAKKKTTRTKKARTSPGKSRATRASATKAKSGGRKKAKSPARKKTKSRVAKKTSTVKKRPKTTTKKTTKSAKTKKTSKKAAKAKAVKKSGSRTPAAARTKGSKAAKSQPGKSRTSLTPPERKPGMLDPTPAHPNDAAHALSTPARLTRKQLNHFRDLLLRRRAELIGDVQAMESGALRGGGSGDSGHAPMHMADAGSDTFDQEFALQLAATERELLEEIDRSLENIKNGTYGICEVTGKPISLPRLEAKPWAKVCIEVARERDRFHRFRH